MNTTHSFTIGEYTVIPEENSIRLADNEKILVQAKIMEVLVYLASSYPRLVSRSELIDSIWSGNYPVGEKTLTNAIWRLRRTLQQDSDSHIETIRKSGYRLLIQPVFISNNDRSLSALNSTRSADITQNKYKYWLFATSIIITLM
jgi:DNA-binding winged helix-turn-helix (wHTH) protein